MEVPELSDGVVTLRAHGPADVDGLVAMATDLETVRWTSVPVPYDRRHAVALGARGRARRMARRFGVPPGGGGGRRCHPTVRGQHRHPRRAAAGHRVRHGAVGAGPRHHRAGGPPRRAPVGERRQPRVLAGGPRVRLHVPRRAAAVGAAAGCAARRLVRVAPARRRPHAAHHVVADARARGPPRPAPAAHRGRPPADRGGLLRRAHAVLAQHTARPRPRPRHRRRGARVRPHEATRGIPRRGGHVGGRRPRRRPDAGRRRHLPARRPPQSHQRGDRLLGPPRRPGRGRGRRGRRPRARPRLHPARGGRAGPPPAADAARARKSGS